MKTSLNNKNTKDYFFVFIQRQVIHLRVWDIHPGYLSAWSLLGEHAEIHALAKIITFNKKGYSKHPETLRWKENMKLLQLRHDLTVREMKLRKFKHHTPLFLPENFENRIRQVSYIDLPASQFEILDKKYTLKHQKGRIPLPRNGSEFWAHHKYSVMARGYQYYKDVQNFLKNRKEYPIKQEDQFIRMIQLYMQKQISSKAANNVTEHLWGYVKNKTNTCEKYNFFHQTNISSKIDYLFEMTVKYKENYLLHSTIFADYLPI